MHLSAHGSLSLWYKSPFCTSEFFPGHSLLAQTSNHIMSIDLKPWLNSSCVGVGRGHEKASWVMPYTWHCSTSGGSWGLVVSFLMLLKLIGGFKRLSLHNEFLHQHLTSWLHHTLLATVWSSYSIRSLQNGNFSNSNTPSACFSWDSFEQNCPHSLELLTMQIELISERQNTSLLFPLRNLRASNVFVSQKFFSNFLFLKKFSEHPMFLFVFGVSL